MADSARDNVNVAFCFREIWDIYTSFLSLNDILSVSVLNTEIYRVADTHGFDGILETFDIYKITKFMCTGDDGKVTLDSSNTSTRFLHTKSMLSILKRDHFFVDVHVNSTQPDTLLSQLSVVPSLVELKYQSFSVYANSIPYVIHYQPYYKITIPWTQLISWGYEKTENDKEILIAHLNPNRYSIFSLHFVLDKGKRARDLEKFMMSRCYVLKLLLNGSFGYVLPLDRNMKDIQAQ